MVQSRLVKLRRRLSLTARLILVLLVAVLLLGNSNLPPTDALEKVRAFTRQVEFDFIEWTFNAFKLKLFETTLGASNFLTEEQRHQLVLEYLALIQQIQRQEAQVEQIYGDPSIGDPQSYARPLLNELEALYARRDKVGPLAESILQDQINAVVAETGLSVGGQALPPVLYHSTPLPLVLIVSPREVIRLDESVVLNGDLSIDEREALEDAVDHKLNVSSLVENIGGLGMYPTMVVESGDLDWLSEVVSHEWVHNYLTLRPLGLSYEVSPEMRVINETVASIAGKEIGRAVLERYYPELVPPPPAPKPPVETPSKPTEPPRFDFRKEMQITRQRADELLAEGKVEEAESYMEARRQVFWENGYRWLRKLNQAYFAFHGAYADEPGGPAGVTEDPVGTAVRELRLQSASLADFLERISWVTSFEQLQKMVEGGQ
ncbi:MAG: hypothetical protein IT316_12190 [Anaerolineales bacterium]|nr:hypothetical protein [Anaerolineales bacterium]